MGTQNTLEQKALDITRILQGLTLTEALEVLANVLIMEGLARLNASAEQRKSALRLLDYVRTDIAQNGQTIANSTVLLGIDLLTALNKA
jgi:hypothetical protein